jgi:hypothetical protein
VDCLNLLCPSGGFVSRFSFERARIPIFFLGVPLERFRISFQLARSVFDDVSSIFSEDRVMAQERAVRAPQTHRLKTPTKSFQATIDGRKRAEYLPLERNYRDGDEVILDEWNPDTGRYTGRSARFRITHISSDQSLGFPAGYGMLSLSDRLPDEPEVDPDGL